MSRLDRATPDDVVSLATDVGPVPMQVGAVLLLDGPVDRAALVDRARDCVAAVPRLRQRLLRAPFLGGRPVWVDIEDFDVADHVTVLPEAAAEVLDVAAEVVRERLPMDRPLWRMVVVPEVRGGSAVVVVFHHVLSDGIGGLAVLAHLVDGFAAPPVTDRRPVPTRRAMLVDAAQERVESLRHLPDGLRRVRDAVVQLRAGSRGTAPRCSLNRPTGAQRRLAVVRVDLADVVRTGKAHGATVNDVVLVAVSAALEDLLAARGERVERLVVSMPVAARRDPTATGLGNQVGAVPVSLPVTGTPAQRLAAVSSATRAAKATTPASSTAVLGPLFRLLAKMGAFGWFIDRQRLVHTFVTNLRGPDAPLTMLGHTVTEIDAVAMITGNVAVSFAVLSYAGTLGITILADPDSVPDLDLLAEALQRRLGELTS